MMPFEEAQNPMPLNEQKNGMNINIKLFSMFFQDTEHPIHFGLILTGNQM